MMDFFVCLLSLANIVVVCALWWEIYRFRKEVRIFVKGVDYAVTALKLLRTAIFVSGGGLADTAAGLVQKTQMIKTGFDTVMAGLDAALKTTKAQ